MFALSTFASRKCQNEILARKVQNEAAKEEARKTGVKVNLKRPQSFQKRDTS
jgi:hypothetical protein